MAGGSGQLTATPLHNGEYGAFNFVFLIEYILCGILCLWFLFYFNRIFATLVSYLVRLLTWHFFGVYVDIEALQISILAGRVFFKGIRYHGDNETIFVHGGYVTWRYWLRKVKPCRLYHEQAIGSEKGKRSSRKQPGYFGTGREPDVAEEGPDREKINNLPCRIEVRVSGVEAFIYNRSPAYDYILETCAQHGSSSAATEKEAQFTVHGEKTGERAGAPVNREQDTSSSSSGSLDSEPKEKPPPIQHSKLQKRTPTSTKYKPPSPPSVLKLFPISVHCNKAAAVLGNENTPAILTAKIESASGEFDASFSANEPKTRMKPNVDYKRPQLAEASILESSDVQATLFAEDKTASEENNKDVKKAKIRKSRWSGLPGLSRRAMDSLESVAMHPHTLFRKDHLPDARATLPGQGRWLGLRRYLDDSQQHDEDEWKGVEYAKASTLAELTRVDFKFYWDIAGPRPLPGVRESDRGQAESTIDVNGGPPPEYGMELNVHGGTVNYGPWADRHRIFLQQLFFPAPFADAAATNRVAAGSTRLCTVFELFLSIEADTVLRIPFREPSKDYKWKGRAETTNQSKQQPSSHRRRRRHTDQTARSTHARAYGWFDVLVKPNSTIKFKQDMYPTLGGYRNDLRVDVSGIDMHSSLNHAMLWRSGNVTVQADLSNPLKWNGLREWTFELGIDDLNFFLLRDHAVLMMDMIEDWTTGLLPEFFTFVPYRYILKPTFNRFKLFLNVNDANIVDQSDEIGENDFAILYCRQLVSELFIPIDRLRPPESSIFFDVTGYDLGFELSMPPKNTLHNFLEDKDVAQLPRVYLKGQYTMCSEVRPGLCETLNMEIIGRGLRGAFYGFFARHLAKIKENYFGEDVHFRTLQEYQELVRNDFNTNEPQAPVRGNDLDVILDITAEDVHILLPCGLYSCKEYVELFVDNANVDLRVNNYYLELMVDSSPLQLLYGSQEEVDGTRSQKLSPPQITIDSVNVYGHRLFGLQPPEPAYVSNWDIGAGDILGQCNPIFVEKIAAAAQALAVTITDEENGLPIPEAAPIYDTTFVRWNSGDIRLWLDVGKEAFSFSTTSVSGSFNDLTTQSTSQKLVLAVPEIVLACVDARAKDQTASLIDSRQTLAYFRTALSLQMVQHAANFPKVQQGQKDHFATHDAPTARAAFLTRDRRADANGKPVSMCLPALPSPLHSRRQTPVRKPGGVATTEPVSSNERPEHRSAARTALNGKLSLEEGRSIFYKPNVPVERSLMSFDEVPELPYPSAEVGVTAHNPQQHIFYSEADDDSVHTSLKVDVKPGITLMCKPRAILAGAGILAALGSSDPEGIYDQYQMDVASGILSILQKQRGQRSVLDMGINVPFMHVRFINTGVPSMASRPSPTDNDEYNVIIEKTVTAVRIKSMPNRKHADDLRAIHVTTESISLSTRPHAKHSEPAPVAFEGRVSDVLLWLADSDRTIVNASYDVVEARVASRELHYLAALIQRAAVLAQELAVPFVELQKRNAQRRLFVIYSLVTAGERVADPSFLTRPSYMIRSAQDHLRNSDSWKIVARLRWVLCCLPKEEKTTLWSHCRNDQVSTPPDVELRMLAALDQWRSWDALHVKDSLAMQLLFGAHTDIEKSHNPGSVPLAVRIHGTSCKVAIDHESKQNEFTLRGLAAAVSITPPPPPSVMQMFHDFREVRLTVVHVSTTSAHLNLNWELCDLVDDIATMIEQDVFLPKTLESRSASTLTAKQGRQSIEEFHIVAQMDTAEINLDALNVQQSFVSENFKVSVVNSSGDATPMETSTSIVASAQEASMTTTRGSQILLRTSLLDSSLALDFRQSAQVHGKPININVAGTSARLGIEICDEIAALLETVSLVVDHEARQIDELLHKHDAILNSEGDTGSKASSAPSIQANVALFLASYKLDVPLVQDLHYCTEGRVLRLGIAPDRGSEMSHTINFDWKGQRHTFLRGRADEPLALSLIDIPPINGSVRILIASRLTTLSMGLTMEQVKLEGLALYGIFSMLSSSGVLEAFETLKGDLETLQEHIQSFVKQRSPAVPPSEPPPGGQDVLFDASVSLVGVTISAQTHKLREEETQANVAFRMGSTHFRTSNRSPHSDAPLPFPELRLSLGEMMTKVERLTGKATQESASLAFAMTFACIVAGDHSRGFTRKFELAASGPQVELDAHTSPIIVSLLGHFQERMKRLDLSRERKYVRRLKQVPMLRRPSGSDTQRSSSGAAAAHPSSLATSFAFTLASAHATYVVSRIRPTTAAERSQNLVLSLKHMQFNTRGEREARLEIEEVKLQLLPQELAWTQRSANSALLPELVFTVGYETSEKERRLLLHAAGKALDVQAHPDVVRPAAELERSLSTSANKTRAAIAKLRVQPKAPEMPAPRVATGSKRLSLLIVDTSFAGAIIRLQDRDPHEPRSGKFASVNSGSASGIGRYSTLSTDTASKDAVLRAPGIAIRVQYTDNVEEGPCLNAEVHIDGSKNVLTPAVVPLVLRIAHNAKEVMHDRGLEQDTKHTQTQKPNGQASDPPSHSAPVDAALIQRNPHALLGRTRLNVGMRIGKQEFAMVCQPIAKVEARMKLEDSYMTINTIDMSEGDSFFAMSLAFTGMEASLQHVYSRDPTFKFYIESVVLSAMNSRHISGKTGISAMLKINPMKAHLNAKQLQDVLLFREIWLPPEVRDASKRDAPQSMDEQQEYFVTRYRQIAASTAFPWNATVAIADLAIELDLGQAIGKMSAHLSNLWASSKKTTSAQQTLCVGIESVSMDARGRMSGFVLLNHLKVRTSIAWPGSDQSTGETPLVQGSVGFKELRLKAAFDYQVFAVSHITSFEFIMYNVKDDIQRTGDRLVAILDGGKVHIYCVAASAALAVSLAQAFERLIQERKASYEQSLKDIDSFLRRRTSTTRSSVVEPESSPTRKIQPRKDKASRLPISLHTDVVVTLGAVDVGAFPRTVMDNQILRLEASDIQARFAVAVEGKKLHSGLGITLGQVRAALAGVPHAGLPKPIDAIEIDEVVRNATSARGGNILRVPKVIAQMQTWQTQGSRNIDYKFKSTFEGKIDVGWNYSRISFIRGMHATHTRTLATRLGKPLPESALTISGAPLPTDQQDSGSNRKQDDGPESQSKITVTSNVNLPQMGYIYRAVEPVIIDTPQLRDMGEATPPLEWIGLHRDKLPNVTHQVVIVALLEVAKEVEDTYSRILGSS